RPAAAPSRRSCAMPTPIVIPTMIDVSAMAVIASMSDAPLRLASGISPCMMRRSEVEPVHSAAVGHPHAQVDLYGRRIISYDPARPHAVSQGARSVYRGSDVHQRVEDEGRRIRAELDRLGAHERAVRHGRRTGEPRQADRQDSESDDELDEAEACTACRRRRARDLRACEDPRPCRAPGTPRIHDCRALPYAEM